MTNLLYVWIQTFIMSLKHPRSNTTHVLIRVDLINKYRDEI